MDNVTIVYILITVLGVSGLAAFSRGKKEKVLGMNKNVAGVIFAGIAAFLLLAQLGYLADMGVSPFAAAGAVTSTQQGGSTVLAGYQPTATFNAKDKFSTTSVVGTSYYKRGTDATTTTAISNTNPGESISYWVDNATYWVSPAVKVAGPGVTSFEALAWSNGTATVTGYDLVNRQSVTGGEYNTSMAANKQANIEITVQGTSKKSSMPFGGVMVVEYNSTISSVTCNGEDLLSGNPFHLTYTVASTQNTYQVFGVGASLDDGSGAVKKITCQFNNGATAAGADSAYYVKFIPANYYVSQDGNVLLDTEKFADGTTVRTGSRNQPILTAYWGA
jgi:hypothetical protein